MAIISDNIGIPATLASSFTKDMGMRDNIPNGSVLGMSSILKSAGNLISGTHEAQITAFTEIRKAHKAQMDAVAESLRRPYIPFTAALDNLLFDIKPNFSDHLIDINQTAFMGLINIRTSFDVLNGLRPNFTSMVNLSDFGSVVSAITENKEHVVSVLEGMNGLKIGIPNILDELESSAELDEESYVSVFDTGTVVVDVAEGIGDIADNTLKIADGIGRAEHRSREIENELREISTNIKELSERRERNFVGICILSLALCEYFGLEDVYSTIAHLTSAWDYLEPIVVNILRLTER